MYSDDEYMELYGVSIDSIRQLNFATNLYNIEWSKTDLFSKEGEGLLYTLNDEKIALRINIHWINEYKIYNYAFNNFPKELLQLILKYTISSIYRNEYILTYFESLPKITFTIQKLIKYDSNISVCYIQKLINFKLKLLSFKINCIDVQKNYDNTMYLDYRRFNKITFLFFIIFIIIIIVG